jgi:hypothetical protein
MYKPIAEIIEIMTVLVPSIDTQLRLFNMKYVIVMITNMMMNEIKCVFEFVLPIYSPIWDLI